MGDIEKAGPSRRELATHDFMEKGEASELNNNSNNNNNNVRSDDARKINHIPRRSAKNSNNNGQKPFLLGDRFFLLNWFYLWVFPLIHRCRQKNFKKILLQLATVLTARKNGEDLDVKWAQERENAARDGR